MANRDKKDYRFEEIEKKWINNWSENDVSLLKETVEDKNKYYMLEMFPYPSGEPHMGHARNYTIGDVLARVMSRKGLNVLHPMGFDAFGLPAENAAIKSGIHPKESTMANIDKMRKALKRMGMTYDFSREIITSEPDYYKWTQWLFLLLFKMGLAEKKEAPVNWCSSCQTVLANEQVISGKCERCDSQVTTRFLSQWFFKITDYAQRLLDDMDKLGGWPERVLTIQRNWIGRSEGATVDFKLDGDEGIDIPVFTTRPDTLFGVTFFILASEHPLVDKIVVDDDNKSQVQKTREKISRQSNIERGAEDVEKIGCFTGRYVINPLNGERVPIWIANYVLLEYGTGAIMAVPAHDSRDFDFAKKYGIEIRQVISPEGDEIDDPSQAYTGEGVMINSGEFNGLDSVEGKKRITDHLEDKEIGKAEINYKLKDWLISRQRYWGAPIPIIYCEKCGTVPVPEEKLPVLLPYDVDFRPKGLSPLSYRDDFVNTGCPECGGNAKRETDTMDTFVCSSWYFLRYCDPKNGSEPFDSSKADYWMPVDQYIGGIEHATMHLIYSRFFTKVLADAGLIDFLEPFTKYFPHGMVNLNGQRMSKSKGNIVSPSEIYNKYGADTLRLYILFIGPADSVVDWEEKGVEGSNRFLKRLWRLVNGYAEGISSAKKQGPDDDPDKISELFKKDQLKGPEKELYRKIHQTIKKVNVDILERFNFNTAISSMMEMVNLLYKYNDEVTEDEKNYSVLSDITQKLLILISPIVPFISEELWEILGNDDSIHEQPWLGHDEEIAKEDMVTIVFQINGKIRDKAQMQAGTPQEEVEKKALLSPRIRSYTEGKDILKKIYVPNKILNIVVK